MSRKLKFSTLFFLIISLTMFLVACSGNEYIGDTNDASTSSGGKNSSEQDVEKKEDKDKEQRENKDVEKIKDENVEESEAKLEIVNSTNRAWQDGVFANWVHSSVIVENTGEVPIKIGETEMDFIDTEGETLGTSSLNSAIPEIIEPGQQAYILDLTLLDKEIDVATYKETTYNFSFEKTSDSPNLLEVSSIESITSMDVLSAPYAVTGIVTNTTNDFQEEILISAALFAEDGSLLGVLRNRVNLGLHPGSEAGIEVSHPDVPKEIFEKVETIEVKAYGSTR